MGKGRFITIEGGEGAGKSTLVTRVRDELERQGREVLLTREPGGTPLGEAIRHLIKDQTDDPPCDRSELLLFLAARAHLVRNVIRPALERGAWVVSDRFSDSTIAYQGYGRGLPLHVIETVNAFACNGLKPDLTILLTVSPETAICRLHSRETTTHTTADRFEREGNDFHARIRSGFERMAKADPDRIKVVDANASVDEVWSKAWNLIKHLN